MNTIIFLAIVLLLRVLVKNIFKGNLRETQAAIFEKYNKENKIEVGYPTTTMQALHINSTNERPIPNHNYTNEQISKFEDDEDDKENQIFTKNMFIESHHELGISLFERELTVQMVNDAYEKALNNHMKTIKEGIPSVFNITDKKEAKKYLLNYLNGSKNISKEK